MYHALVRQNDGDWVSFGVHAPSNQWSLIFQVLTRAHGQERVGYLYWPTDDEAITPLLMAQRIADEVDAANEAQRNQDLGILPREEEGEPITLARLVILNRSLDD